ncbi:hypothetical protein AB0K68_53110, partial [Streptomyces sp. NPDC050698]
GNPVYLFVNHPYFQYWVNLLGLDRTNFQTDCMLALSASVPISSNKALRRTRLRVFRKPSCPHSLGSTIVH